MSRHITRANSEYLLSSTTPITAAPFTFCAWVRADVSMSGDDYCIMQIQNPGSTTNYFRVNVDNGPFVFWVGQGGAYDAATSSVSPTVGKWYFVAAIARSSTDREILVDGGGGGVAVVDITPLSMGTLAIGREMDSTPADSWDGDIGPVGLWDRALTLPEIRLMATGYPMAFVRSQNLYYWPLRDGNDFEWRRRYDMIPYSTPTISPHPPKVIEYWNKIRRRAVTTQSIAAFSSWNQPNVWTPAPKAPSGFALPIIPLRGIHSVIGGGQIVR